jgi:hypothetical protein
VSARWVRPEFDENFSTELSLLADRIKFEAEVCTYALDDIFHAGSGKINRREAFVQRRELHLSLLCMKYANTLVSAPLYLISPVGVRGTSDVDLLLKRGAGICMQQSGIFLALAEKLGLSARMVQVFGTKADGSVESHVAVETFVGGKWRYFDPSYAAYAHKPHDRFDVLSAEDLRQKRPFAWKGNQVDPWSVEWEAEFGDPIRFIFATEDVELFYDGTGVATIPYQKNEFCFSSRFNFIGTQWLMGGRMGQVELAFQVPKGQGLALSVEGSSVLNSQAVLEIWCDGALVEQVKVGKLPDEVVFPYSGLIKLAIAEGDKACVVVKGAGLTRCDMTVGNEASMA